MNENMKKIKRQQFIDDLWYIVRRFRDMRRDAEKYGVKYEIENAQSQLAGALGTLENKAAERPKEEPE